MRLSVARELLVFGSIVSLGFLAAVGLYSLTIKQIEIGSAEYNRIIELNDLPADVQPPALSLTQAHETAALYESLALAAALIAVVLLLSGIFAIRRRVVRPIGEITEYMAVLANGSYDREVPFTNRSDEIGRMAQSVEAFRHAIIESQEARDAADQERRSREEAESDVTARRAEEDQQRREVIESVASGLRHLADGDLSYKLSEPFVSEYEELRAAFNRTVEILNTTISDITGSTDIVQTGATEISQAADDLSRRTEQQAASLEETAAALDEITTTVRNSATAAEEAGQMVDDAKDGARKSGTIVKDAITAMQRIEQSSDKISQIIGVIDDIAFQTNLLALNAGVEAARAGDAGKGFAVVAQEVRELAQRSANAAKEIKDLITNSVTEVGDGVSLVSQTGEALEEIEQHVLKINDRVSAIVTSSREQTSGLQEINTAINQMDQVTQQNAAMVEETNAACQNLTAESGKLRGLVAAFDTGTVGYVTREPAPAPIPVLTPAHETSKPVASPARSLGKKLASAFGVAGGAVSASAGEANDDDWTEF
ncbi:methyl-accepting chemotaxis protein [Hoeflea sp.]|uniref:methyl-accepting chemotaxis protein n=1 Tax=Hoeflea sp. TaxID=1940281 RepID=UPI003B01D36B